MSIVIFAKKTYQFHRREFRQLDRLLEMEKTLPLEDGLLVLIEYRHPLYLYRGWLDITAVLLFLFLLLKVPYKGKPDLHRRIFDSNGRSEITDLAHPHNMACSHQS
jgi:hypothetical protein